MKWCLQLQRALMNDSTKCGIYYWWRGMSFLFEFLSNFLILWLWTQSIDWLKGKRFSILFRNNCNHCLNKKQKHDFFAIKFLFFQHNFFSWFMLNVSNAPSKYKLKFLDAREQTLFYYMKNFLHVFSGRKRWIGIGTGFRWLIIFKWILRFLYLMFKLEILLEVYLF